MKNPLLAPTITICFLIASAINGFAYTPENHEKSIIEGAQICKANHRIEIDSNTLANVIKGSREPDAFGISSIQMLKQRIEPGSYGRQRNINALRIAAQSLHGSPNPTRKIYSNSPSDKALLANAIRIDPNQLIKDRLNVDIFSYNTNQTVRNKLLINASKFMCVSLAHKSKAQSAKKFGNFMHMVGDTYSASHVQRSPPQGTSSKCGTEKITWYFSMDLISWKQHRPADIERNDWRFKCLTEHTSNLMALWSSSRKALNSKLSSRLTARNTTTEVSKTLKYLCQNVLQQDASLLSMPAGGASRNYSSASGTDNWNFFLKNRPVLAIQPVGLTSAQEAEKFYESVRTQLKKMGSKADFSYPSRDLPDLCASILKGTSIHPSLQCTQQEINWATSASPRINSMWLPSRPQ